MAPKPDVSAYTGLMRKPYLILAEWDPDARVWVATSGDVPGLATESATLESLDAKLRVMVPELLEANGVSAWDEDATYELVARRFGALATALS